MVLDDGELGLVLVELEVEDGCEKDDCEEHVCAAHGKVAEVVNN